MSMALRTYGYHDLCCAACGLAFCVTTDFEQRRRKDHHSFYCPAGHKNFWDQESDEERLKRQLTEANKQLDTTKRRLQFATDERDAYKRSRSAVKASLTKATKKLQRVVNGVCPCCTRSFADLHRHMKTKHPTYKPRD